jgi:wyosine [tRNA(Phe)-imidazoG37] synthetase (radical SAM superfamily)
LNLNPDKVCNFDCPYCQVDRTPEGLANLTPGVDVSRLSAELDGLLAWVEDGSLWSRAPFDTAAPEHRHVVDVAFAGDGEPTSSRAFTAAAAAVQSIRDQHGLSATPIRLLTNATLLHRASVQTGLTHIDEIWAKLDAGTPEWFAKVDGTTFPFERILKNLTELAKARPITLQCMFPAMDGQGPTDSEVDAWVGRLCAIRDAGGTIAEVQVYTVARTPSSSRVGRLSLDRLEQIAERARAKGFKVCSYG